MSKPVFTPENLKLPKKGKKVFGLIVIVFWISAFLVTLIGIRFQSKLDAKNNNKTIEILPVIKNQDQSQTDSSTLKMDEVLGSKVFKESSPLIESNGNPIGGSGSVDDLLKGQEIVVP